MFGKIISALIAVAALFSCAPPQLVHISTNGSYPPREEGDSVVIYKKEQDIPSASKRIGSVATMTEWWFGSPDSAYIFSLAISKIKRAGGNALLITEYQKTTILNFPPTSLKGDVYLVSDFSSPLPSRNKVPSNFYIGFGFGPETCVAIIPPKVSYYNFQDRKCFETYYGAEVSLNGVVTPMMSLDCLYGIKKSIFTLDTSIGIWWHPKVKAYDYEISGNYLGPHFHTTINPKIGLKFWKLWFKAGPSFHIYKNYAPGQEDLGIANIGKIGKLYYNFEILIEL